MILCLPLEFCKVGRAIIQATLTIPTHLQCYLYPRIQHPVPALLPLAPQSPSIFTARSAPTGGKGDPKSDDTPRPCALGEYPRATTARVGSGLLQFRSSASQVPGPSGSFFQSVRPRLVVSPAPVGVHVRGALGAVLEDVGSVLMSSNFRHPVRWVSVATRRHSMQE